MDMYAAAKQLTFRLAMGVLLGLQLDEERLLYLARTFEQLMDNLFSLPIDAPFSGLRKVGGACGLVGAREFFLGSSAKRTSQKLKSQYDKKVSKMFIPEADWTMSLMLKVVSHGHQGHLTDTLNYKIQMTSNHPSI